MLYKDIIFSPLSLFQLHFLSDITDRLHGSNFVSLSMFDGSYSDFLYESHLSTSSVFCHRTAVMSTASHTVGIQPCTAPVAEVRWTQCDCC